MYVISNVLAFAWRRDVPRPVAAWHPARLRRTSERAVRLGVSRPTEVRHPRVADVTAQWARGRPGRQGPWSQGRWESWRLRFDGHRGLSFSHRHPQPRPARHWPAAAWSVPRKDRTIQFT